MESHSCFYSCRTKTSVSLELHRAALRGERAADYFNRHGGKRRSYRCVQKNCRVYSGYERGVGIDNPPVDNVSQVDCFSHYLILDPLDPTGMTDTVAGADAGKGGTGPMRPDSV